MLHPEITSIGIIGNGMIGDSMCVLTTGHGYKTVSLVRDPSKIPGYKNTYDRYYHEMISHDILTKDQFHICEQYLEYTDNYAGLSECQVIFECITEDLDAKWSVYESIETFCPNVKAICSVSSSFLPDRLGEKMKKYKDRIIVTHPFNPAHMVPYFEICTGDNTDPALAQWVKDFLITLDRKPAILKKPNPGFIGNYLQFALWAAALKLVEDGVCEPEDIDTCLNYSFCPRYTSIGMFEHFDNGGYKLNVTTCNSVFPILPRYEKAPDLIREKADSSDHWGAKSSSGCGFYDWNDVDITAYQERVNKPYWDFCRWDFPEK